MSSSNIFSLQDPAVASSKEALQSTFNTEQASKDDGRNSELGKSEPQHTEDANSELIIAHHSNHKTRDSSGFDERHSFRQSEQTDRDSTNIDRTPPGRVGTVIVKVISTNQIDLKWTGVEDSDLSHYNVYIGTKSSFKVTPGVTVPSGTSKTNSYSSNGLKPSTTYFYKIAAVDDANNIGSLSIPRSGKTDAVGSIQNDNPSGKTGASIQNDNPPQKVGGLTAASADTRSPAKVTGLVVTTVSSTQLNLVWTRVTASDFHHYNIYRGTTSGFTVTPGVTQPARTSIANSYSDSGLNPFTKYYYRVAAVDNAGNIGQLSSQVSNRMVTNQTKPTIDSHTPLITTKSPQPTMKEASNNTDITSSQIFATSSRDRTPPGQVTGLVVTTVSSTQLNLVWTRVTASDFNHYNIYRGTSSGFTVTPGVTQPARTSIANSYSDSGLNPSTKYYYRVAAVDNAGNIGRLSSQVSQTTAAPVGTQSSIGLYVPLYTYPTSPTWNTLVNTKNAHPNLPIVVTINPSSGVGSSQDIDFVNGIKNLKSAGIKVIGYVYTSYGQRSTTVIQGEINKYKSWYGVNGIFFDEMSNSGGLEGYYSNLNSYVKSTGMTFTMGNPGTDISSSYVGTMDSIIIYERQGLPSVDSLKGWHTSYDKKNFSIIPFGVSSLDTQFISNVKNYVGWIYITNDGLPNPWDSLPSYFSNLVSALDS